MRSQTRFRSTPFSFSIFCKISSFTTIHRSIKQLISSCCKGKKNNNNHTQNQIKISLGKMKQSQTLTQFYYSRKICQTNMAIHRKPPILCRVVVFWTVQTGNDMTHEKPLSSADLISILCQQCCNRCYP